MKENPYNCGNWQNSMVDSFTTWNDAYLHRGLCYAPDGVLCPHCDSKERLTKFQQKFRNMIDTNKNPDCLADEKEILAAHQAKWGVLTLFPIKLLKT